MLLKPEIQGTIKLRIILGLPLVLRRYFLRLSKKGRLSQKSVTPQNLPRALEGRWVRVGKSLSLKNAYARGEQKENTRISKIQLTLLASYISIYFNHLG